MAVKISFMTDAYMAEKYDLNTLRRIHNFAMNDLNEDDITEQDRWFLITVAYGIDYYTRYNAFNIDKDKKASDIDKLLHCISLMAMAEMTNKRSAYIDRQMLVKTLAAGLFFYYYNKSAELGTLYGIYTDEYHRQIINKFDDEIHILDTMTVAKKLVYESLNLIADNDGAMSYFNPDKTNEILDAESERKYTLNAESIIFAID